MKMKVILMAFAAAASSAAPPLLGADTPASPAEAEKIKAVSYIDLRFSPTGATEPSLEWLLALNSHFTSAGRHQFCDPKATT